MEDALATQTLQEIIYLYRREAQLPPMNLNEGIIRGICAFFD